MSHFHRAIFVRDDQAIGLRTETFQHFVNHMGISLIWVQLGLADAAARVADALAQRCETQEDVFRDLTLVCTEILERSVRAFLQCSFDAACLVVAVIGEEAEPTLLPQFLQGVLQ